MDLNRTPSENLRAIAEATGQGLRDLTAVVLDRDRHSELYCRDAATPVPASDSFLTAMSPAPSRLQPATPPTCSSASEARPRALSPAAALKCLGGELQGRLWPRNDHERQAAVAAGFDLDRVLHIDDLVQSDDVFFAATGITDGELLHGVKFTAHRATTDSLVMRSRSGTVRRIEATHDIDKLSAYAAVDFT